MRSDALNSVLLGALWMSSWVASLYFLRFWRSSRDRFFVFMSLAFCLLGLSWLSLALLPFVVEQRHELFMLRLLAFSLILGGIADKNRRAATRGSRWDG